MEDLTQDEFIGIMLESFDECDEGCVDFCPERSIKSDLGSISQLQKPLGIEES